MNIESTLVGGNDLESQTKVAAANLNKFDVLITVTEPQRIYWSALMTSAGRMPKKDDFVIVPVGFEPRPGFYNPDLKNPVVVFAGSFYPWQDPSLALLETARYFETRGNGELHVYGGAHEFCKDHFRDLFKQLSQFSRTRLMGFVSREHVQHKIASAICVLDLMDYNFEREMAMTTRTVEYLSLGAPVIYSNFNWLAEKISQYDAGWCLEPGNRQELNAVLVQITAGDASMLRRKSNNALALSRSEFAPTLHEEALDRILTQRVERHLHSLRGRYKRARSSRQPRVLAVCPGYCPIKSLRLDGPLRSLLGQGLISSYAIVSPVLVTGAAGFIGSHVAEHCLKLGMHVTATDNLSGGFLSNVPEGCVWIKGDLRDDRFVNGLFEREGFDYVYHLGAYAAEGLSHFVRRHNYTTNLTASVNLINAAINTDCECFIFTSSIAVYGAGQSPMTEDMTPLPVDPYGISKYAVELDLKAAHKMFGLNYIIFRPHNVYGERQNIADKYRNVIGIFMNQILHGKPMTLFGDGLQTRAFSHVDDVAPIIARSPLVERAHNETFNIGADQEYTILNLAHIIARGVWGRAFDCLSAGAKRDSSCLLKSRQGEKSFSAL